MGRHSKDARLTILANELKKLVFPATKELLERHHEMMINTDSTHSCYLMPNGFTWAVRMHFCGAMRTLGYSDVAINAFQFADMAQVFFYKYKQRNAYEPTDEYLNYGLALAKENLATHAEARALLERIEAHFKENGIIPNHEEVRAERIMRRRTNESKRNERRTVSGQMVALFKQLEQKLDALEKQIDLLQRTVARGPHRVTVPVKGGPSVVDPDVIVVRPEDFTPIDKFFLAVNKKPDFQDPFVPQPANPNQNEQTRTSSSPAPDAGPSQ